ncbi:toll/interleukin-1 receptor domain-containing protein [Methanothrix sp.]|uniref:toll/interleukin-1 receptor domain-containing protein n=1 Tax=Methanothrix sp. TaxID=90426 RepID=UPI0025D9DF5F|nr:toll/interleukin-1 receptor domain-containing protein [Methanothrix sp.]
MDELRYHDAKMISRIYISHDPDDEDLALRLSLALERVGLESYSALYNQSPAIALADRVSFAIRNSECLVALVTQKGSRSPLLCQEIGLARGIDLLIIPLQEEGVQLPFLIDSLRPLSFRRESYADAIGILIKTIRELGRLEWLKVVCPRCEEEMTQYLTDQDEVDSALEGRTFLETICSYCQNAIQLDPRTFEPLSGREGMAGSRKLDF